MSFRPVIGDGHCFVRLIVEPDEYAEPVTCHIPWADGRALPESGTSLRLKGGVMLHVRTTVLNAFPVLDGEWGDIILDGRLLADGTIMLLLREHVIEMIDDVIGDTSWR